ncbi:SDR family oxidoreductase [Prochlorococcus marinus XMU1419]|uniref:SDR family oxidoreductase n=1 Tax=Prochlorococcus marinus TaxID=1219 RepID=UPI001ADC6F2C|nr:SDR family oxidoreductase [Prochlorococcus marinus]MBO8234265.1 SDR family oxidoreductase [Prochlorococcus marinus XMU1419]MBW3075955.1 hypothetical protein [Prochlorococcus marinus str. XMU1419]
MKIITGASSGIGKSLVENIDDKESLILISRRDPKVPKAQYIYCDFTDKGQLNDLIVKIKNITSKIDLIVHSAGIMKSTASNKLGIQELNDSYMVNTLAPLFITSSLMKELSRVKGTAIAISSIASMLDIHGEVIYSSSKAALDKGFEILAADLSRLGVSFIKIHPCLIDTPMTENLSKMQKEFMISKQSSKASPTPEEIAKYILSLKDQPKFISGSSILFGGVRR